MREGEIHMNQQDRIAITLQLAKKTKHQIGEILAESYLGDSKLNALEEQWYAMDDVIEQLEVALELERRYVESGNAARDFQEGELLRQAESNE
jgi:hypothetical protein